VTLFRQNTAHVVGATASFHSNDTGGLLRGERNYAIAPHTTPHCNGARLVKANNATAVFPKVDPKYGNGHGPAPFSYHRSTPR
jgi:hypothetical protein